MTFNECLTINTYGYIIKSRLLCVCLLVCLFVCPDLNCITMKAV